MACVVSRASLRLRSFFVVVILVVLSYGDRAHGGERSRACTGEVYDVTEYGAATSSSDNKDAFLAAWRAACGSSAGGNATTLLFPNGSFAVGAVEFAGPCGAEPVVVVIEGALRPSGGGGGRHISSDSWIAFKGLNNLLVTGAGTLDGSQCDVDSGGNRKSKPTTLVFEDVSNVTVSDLAFVNSPGFHVTFRNCSGVVAEGLRIHAPADSRNTDGIHVGHSRDVRIRDSVIGTGDDCVSIGPGSTDVAVTGVVCGPGHGISVGSLGWKDEEDVRGVVVRNCTLRGTANGARIKTWAGAPPSRASNITFEDIVMDNVSNPVIIDQRYCPHGRCSDADKPSLVQISDVTFKQIEGTSRSRVAVQLLCSEERPCTGVRLVDISLDCGHRACEKELVNVQGTAPPSPDQQARRRSVRNRAEQLDR